VPEPAPAPRPSTPHHPGFPASMPPLPRTVLTPPLPMPSDLTPIPPSIAPPAMARDVLAAEEPEVERTYAVYARAAAFAAVVAVGLGATYTIAERSESGASQSSAVADAVTTPARAAAAPACPEGMIAVPGGRFYMGSDDDVTAEKPAHAVTLTAYCIDASEVTADRYRACSDEGKCKRTAHGNEWRGITKKERDAFDPLCTTGGDTRGRGQHPANCVSWEMASAFCAASGARLPTEAEWEFAARGPDGRRYPWGDEEPTSKHLNACGKECVARGRAHGAPEVAMFKDDDHFATTAPVGSFPIGDSRFGLHDMAGNVREWTADLYGDYTAGAQIDPTGPASGDAHVIRGGAWDASRAAEARATLRDGKGPDTRSHGIGFRCARSLTP
jgi:formylglycine-generating enzyme required for sulfatase activity